MSYGNYSYRTNANRYGTQATATRWYKVAANGKSWVFSDYNLALRCAQTFRTNVQNGKAPSSQWRHMANQAGPHYR